MHKKERAEFALVAVFPTSEALLGFIEDSDDRNRLKSFIDYALTNHLIDSCDEDEFREFILKNSREAYECSPPDNIKLEELIDNKKDILGINLSNRGLIGRINSLLKRCGIKMPELSNTMVTRLKYEPADTPRKRDALRSLAFWIGHERSYKGSVWNYETLIRMCNKFESSLNHKEGVRVAFSIYSRGDVVGHEIVGWLKKELQSYIKSSLKVDLSVPWGGVKWRDLTTLYIDFPKQDYFVNLVSYQRSIRNAISVAHQISIRWSFSKYSTRNRFLAIGIAAGAFSGIDNYLLPILDVKLPGDPVIRMTDYARQCVLINGIKVIFNKTPKEVELFNGEALNIWWIVELWSMIYWDFVPGLLDEEILGDDAVSVKKLTNQVLYPETASSSSETSHSKSISTFLEFPQNTLLGFEIAKTLYFRRRFMEAEEILRILLSTNPLNITARALRMSIFRNYGIEAVNYRASGIMFRRAEKEAEYIIDNFKSVDDDFYYECAVLKVAEAMKNLQLIRENQGIYKDGNINITAEDVFVRLNDAEEILIKGSTVSSTGYRVLYLIICIHIIRIVLRHNNGVLCNAEVELTCPNRIIKDYMLELILSAGWSRENFPDKFYFEAFDSFVQKALKIYDESVAFDAYKAGIYHGFAVALWDMVPYRNVAIAKRVISVLQGSIEFAERVAKNGFYIYSYARLLGEIIPPDTFISHVKDGIDALESRAGKLSMLEKMNPEDPVEIEDDDFVLLTMHI